MAASNNCMAMVASVLQKLGHDCPDAATLSKLMGEAFDKIKADKGIDPDQYSMRVVAIEKCELTQALTK